MMLSDIEAEIELTKPFAVCYIQNELCLFKPQEDKLITDHGLIWWSIPFSSRTKQTGLGSTDKDNYLEGLKKTIAALKDKKLEKVVISRTLQENLDTLDIKGFIIRLVKDLHAKYPNAFVFAHSPEEGKVWVGATPEILLQSRAGEMKTVALAGTRLRTEEQSTWGEKEKGEQQNVVDFIKGLLNSNDVNDLNISQPYTAQAGHLEHIKSDISFTSSLSDKKIATILHPTSAVCGMPRDKALQWIEEIESHDRGYYAGAIGYHSENEFSSFVQLRCALLDVHAMKITYFAGGGIMPDSDPELEWKETENKIEVLRGVVKKIEQSNGI